MTREFALDLLGLLACIALGIAAFVLAPLLAVLLP